MSNNQTNFPNSLVTTPNKFSILNPDEYKKWRNKEIQKIVDYCKTLKENGKIKSAYQPVCQATGLSWITIYNIYTQKNSE